MIRKFLLLFTTLFFLLIIYSGCQQKSFYQRSEQASESYEPRWVKNVKVINYNTIGDSWQYYRSAPQKVIVAGENLLETFVALGIEDNILLPIGYNGYFFEPDACYAARYAKLPVQKGIHLTKEKVLEMQPDLIVGGQVLFANDALSSTDFWNERNIHTYCSSNANSPTDSKHQETVEGEFEFISGLGKIYGREAAARLLIDDMRLKLQTFQQAVHNMVGPRVLIVEDLGSIFVTYGRNKLAGDICGRLNGRVLGSGATIGLEDLLRLDPDVLFVVKSDGNPEQAAEWFRRLPVLRNCSCVKNNRVYGIALSYTYNSAVKTGEGISILASGMYPDLSKELNSRY